MSEIRPEDGSGHEDSSHPEFSRDGTPLPPQSADGNSNQKIEPSNEGGPTDGDAVGRKPRKKIEPPTEDQCAIAIFQIPAMMLGGFYNTNQAKVACSAYSTVLGHLRLRSTGKSAPAVEQEDLLERVRKNPSLINLLAGILPQEQIDEILREIQGDADEAA